MTFTKICFVAGFVLVLLFGGLAQAQVTVVDQFKKHLSYLADDALEGRATGTKGERLAYTYIAGQFLEIGLTPYGDDGTYLQTFEFTSGKELGKKNNLVVNGTSFMLEDEYIPTLYSSNGNAKGSVVNVGFGISAPEKEHDDYKGRQDLKGKIFLMDITSPDGIHPHSKFAKYSDMRTKVDLAIQKGAIGIIFINSDLNVADPSLEFDKKITPASIPVVFLKSLAWKKIKDEKSLKAEISIELIKVKTSGKNVVGFLDNQAENTIVIGGHYDHLGYGHGRGSLYRGEEKQIHNGADDNASGTAMVIELAHHFKAKGKGNNNFLFIAFSGEELGLYGSNAFVDKPSLPLEKVNYMINFDMVGRMDSLDHTLGVNGSGTSPAWEPLVNNIHIDSMHVRTSESGVGPSDHTSFYLKDIPVLHLFTGTHADYHKPSDDVDKINFRGMEEVFRYTVALVDSLEDDGKLAFTKTKDADSRKAPKFSVTLGVVPDYLYDGKGMKIDGVSEDKPAKAAGMQAGDIVIKMGDLQIVDMMSYMKGLSMFKKGDTVPVVVKRGDKEITLEVTF